MRIKDGFKRLIQEGVQAVVVQTMEAIKKRIKDENHPAGSELRREGVGAAVG